MTLESDRKECLGRAMTERWQDIAERAVTLPALVVVAVLVLLAGGLVVFVAVQSGDGESHPLTGTWQIGLVVHRGPSPGSVGQSLSCTARLNETDTVLDGEMECDLFGASQEVSGFAFSQSDNVRLAASFAVTTVEVQAKVVSPNQMIGSWEDGQGFAGRFVAIKS